MDVTGKAPDNDSILKKGSKGKLHKEAEMLIGKRYPILKTYHKFLQTFLIVHLRDASN